MNIKWIQKYTLLFVKSATSRRIYENEIKWQYTNDWNYSNVHDLWPRDFHYSVKPPCTVNRASNLIAWNQGGPVYIPGKTTTTQFVCESTYYQAWEAKRLKEYILQPAIGVLLLHRWWDHILYPMVLQSHKAFVYNTAQQCRLRLRYLGSILYMNGHFSRTNWSKTHS